MIQIEESPVKKIILHQVVQITKDEFIEMYAGKTERVFWSKGLLLFFVHFTETDDLIKEQYEEDLIRWRFVEYALCPEKPKILKTNGMETEVIDGDKNPVIMDVAKYLKYKNLSQKEKELVGPLS